MSGDFGPDWNQEPARNEAPKQEKSLYDGDPKRHKHPKWVIWFDVACIVVALGLFVWYVFYR